MVEWRDAFKQVAAVLGCAGLTSGNSGEPDVVGVMGVLRELKAAHETAQVRGEAVPGERGVVRGGGLSAAQGAGVTVAVRWAEPALEGVWGNIWRGSIQRPGAAGCVPHNPLSSCSFKHDVHHRFEVWLCRSLRQDGCTARPATYPPLPPSPSHPHHPDCVCPYSPPPPIPHHQHPHPQEDLAGVRRGLAEAQVALAGAVLENSELRREAAAGWMAAEPAVVQVRCSRGQKGEEAVRLDEFGAGCCVLRLAQPPCCCHPLHPVPGPPALPPPCISVTFSSSPPNPPPLPALPQVRGLVLDPAVAREFEGLRRSCEEKSRLVLGLKEEAEGLAFTQVKGARGKGVDRVGVG